jgi:hypothetical protein
MTKEEVATVLVAHIADALMGKTSTTKA